MTKTVLCASCDVNCMVSVEVPESGAIKELTMGTLESGIVRFDAIVQEHLSA